MPQTCPRRMIGFRIQRSGATEIAKEALRTLLQETQAGASLVPCSSPGHPKTPHLASGDLDDDEEPVKWSVG